MLEKEEGMILIVVLIFLSLISLLVVMSSEMSALEQRMSLNQLRYNQNFQAALAGLKQGEYSLLNGSSACEVALISRNDLLAKSDNWWRSSATCHGNFANHPFQYVIEDLQIDPCAIISDHQGVKFWRITSHAEQSKKYGTMTILQETIAAPFKSEEECHDKIRPISDVRQSWSILY